MANSGKNDMWILFNATLPIVDTLFSELAQSILNLHEAYSPRKIIKQRRVYNLSIH